MTKKGYSEIYLIISPSKKRYVGQTQCVDSKGKTYGTIERWKCHIRDAFSANGGRCRLLNEEIRKFKAQGFVVTPLLSCRNVDSDKFEISFIEMYNSINNNGQNKEGLNIRKGGNSGDRLPLDTRQRMSVARKRYASANPEKVKLTAKTKQQISECLIDKVVRYDHCGNLLPKYMKYVVWKDRRGYQIVNHPQCKCKYFVSSQEDIEALKARCLQFLRDITPS